MPKLQKSYILKFNLILYYAITSFAVIALLSLVVGWIFSRMEGQSLIKRSEEYAHYFISNLNYEIYKDFFIPTLGRDKQIDLKNNRRQFKKLDKVIRENMYGLKIKKLYLYDLEGHIIYSNSMATGRAGLPLERGVNKKLDSAIRGKPAFALCSAKTMDSKGIYVVETLLETYYPFTKCRRMGRKRDRWGYWRYTRTCRD